nr:sugar phosphate isomerase/epimerase [Bacillota bacterium]
MKKGIRGHDVSANGIREICKKCERSGIEYLQLVLEKSVENFSYGEFSEKYAKSLKKELGNMKLAILGSYINIANADDDVHFHDIARFKEKIKYASILNPIAVGTETGIYKDESMNDTEEAYERVLETFKAIIPEAEKYNVNIGIEGVKIFVINTPQKMKRLLDDIASNNI